MKMHQLKHRHYIRLYVRSASLCEYTPLSQWVKQPDEKRADSAYQIFLRDRAEIEGRNYDD